MRAFARAATVGGRWPSGYRAAVIAGTDPDHRPVFGLATAVDVDDVVALVEAAYRGDASRQGWTTEADLLDGQRVDAAMVAELLTDGGAVVLTARSGATLVACCELRHHPADHEVHLGMFAVRPGLQGGGVGRRVLAEAEALARSRWGAGRMVLSVIDVRHELIGWYERRGYARTGETRPFPYGDERFGRPTRGDLRFALLAKELAADVPTGAG